MKKLFGKAKKVATTGVDFGEGVRATVSADDTDQEMLDTLFSACCDMAPRVYECAFHHIEEFSKEDQELIKAIWDGLHCDEVK